MATQGLRAKYTTYVSNIRLVTETCYSCSVLFAMTEEQWNALLKSGRTFYCPNGHRQSFILGKTDEQKLKDAEAREVALKDQLSAAIREGDAARAEVLRIRQRIANGVCPCCTRSFPDVLAHMATKHPDYSLPKNVRHATDVEFRCSCGRTFESFQGMRVHQGTQRRDGWDAPNTSRWSSHLTVV